MDSPRIAYAPRPDTTPETEVSALANIYKLCLSRNRNAAGMTSTNGDDAKKGSPKHEVRATQNYTG